MPEYREGLTFPPGLFAHKMPQLEKFEHYELLKHQDGSFMELGHGAMGVTYKAFDTNLRCNVALKVISAAYLNYPTAA